MCSRRWLLEDLMDDYIFFFPDCLSACLLAVCLPDAVHLLVVSPSVYLQVCLSASLSVDLCLAAHAPSCCPCAAIIISLPLFHYHHLILPFSSTVFVPIIKLTQVVC